MTLPSVGAMNWPRFAPVGLLVRYRAAPGLRTHRPAVPCLRAMDAGLKPEWGEWGREGRTYSLTPRMPFT